jgi:diguanylate cyclase (GGDEF)-like protein/PAS domain S-box-containing protein
MGRLYRSAYALLIASVTACLPVAAQDNGGNVGDIASAIARRDTAGPVTIAGRATVASGKLQTGAFDIAIQDGTGGIRIYSRTPQTSVAEGDSVIATGTIKRYRGNVELVATRVTVIAGALRQLHPLDVVIDTGIIARHMGELVRVHGRVSGAGRSEGGQWLRLRDTSSPSGGTVTIWVPANHGATIDLARASAADSVVATGIVTSYQDNAEDEMVWQIVPRDINDIEVGALATNWRDWILWGLLAAAVLTGGILVIGRIHTRRHLHALRETEARYRQLLALLPDGVIVHARGTILFTNPAAAELLGLPSEKALVGRPLAEFIHPESIEAFADRSDVADTTESNRTPPARARMINTSGGEVDVEVASSACLYHDRPAMVLLARDITAQLRYERDLHALALVDELTGLQNRRAFTLFAEQELARGRRSGRTPVLVFADLDGLKQINDEHGHAAGDVALKLVANALRSIFRETDIVARWSGDEFVALMVDGSEEAAQLIADRLDAAVASLTPARLAFTVTASVGASRLDPALPLRDAMERADAELYAQKKRNRRSKIRSTPIGVDTINIEG